MKTTLIFFIFFLASFKSFAQLSDSLRIQIGTNATVASNDYLPFWLISNRFGTIQDKQLDFSSHLKISSKIVSNLFNRNDNKERNLIFEIGFDVYNNNALNSTFLKEAYLRADIKKIHVVAGRFEDIIGEIDPLLSSGSLGMSGNSLPIPKLNLIIDYFNVPFTNGFLQIKGSIGHGWMGDRQYLKDAFLHQKTIYGRLGKGKLRLYGGIEHFAVWGGNRFDAFGGNNLNKSFKGFLDVLFAFEANDGSVPGDIQPNRAGDHRGILEAGIDWENDRLKININNQTPFEMGQNIDIRNIDRLLSLNITNKNIRSRFKRITLEFIHTKQMNNFYGLQYRENYYNNGVYRTGWEYQDHIIGTNLFINRVRGAKYFDNVKPYDWDAPKSEIPALTNIINPRVIGGHIGSLFTINSQISSRTMLTYTKNYGDYYPGNFSGGKTQSYVLEETTWNPLQSNITLLASVALDVGDFSHSFGSMLGIQWNIKRK